MAYVRTVKTASGAIAVQIVYSSRRSRRSTEHLGPAHDDGELEALKAAARQRLAAGQGELDLGLAAGTSPGGPLEITSSRIGHLWEARARDCCLARQDPGQGESDSPAFTPLILAAPGPAPRATSNPRLS